VKQLSWRLLCLCSLVLLQANAAVAQKASWTQWRGDNRENKSSFVGLNTNWKDKAPEHLATIEGMGNGYASVSVEGGFLYTTGNRDNAQCVIAVNLEKQNVAWVTPVTDSAPKHGYDGSRCTPTIDGQNLYVVSSDGQIICLNRANGSVVWSKNFKQEWSGKMHSGWGFSESPLVDGENVLCTPGGKEAMVVCLNKKTGDTVWKSSGAIDGGAGKDGAGYSSIVISNAAGIKQYVTLVGKGLIGVRADNGELLWSYNRIANNTANIPTALISGDYVFTSSGYNDGGAALLKIVKDGNKLKAEEVYYFGSKDLQNHHGGMVLIGKHIFMGHGHNNGFPMCVELETGKKLWKDQRGPGKSSAAITWVDGHLIFRYQDGTVALIEANPNEYILKGSFKPVFQERESWSQPVVVAGKLYLREQNKLMIYNVAK
jgi:outer membrane protein assembly factor BamB